VEPFRHEAVFYDGPEAFVRRIGPFIVSGLAADEPVLVMAPPDRNAALRAHLGDDACRVRFADMSVVGRNPARIIPAWRDFAGEHAGRRARGVGEPIWSSRSPDELDECHIHESLLNLAFAGGAGFWLACPYDTRSLPPAVVAEARRTHPLGDGEPTGEYAGVPSAASALSRPLPPPPPDAREMAFFTDNVRSVRGFARKGADAFGLNGNDADAFALAAHEVAINTILHGGGAGILRLWETAAALTGDVTDAGSMTMPLVGRIRPTPDQEGGRGVWLTNQLCDLVQIRTGPAGTTVRFHMARRERQST